MASSYDHSTASANTDDGAAVSNNSTAKYDYSDGMIIGLNAWIDAAIQTVKTVAVTTGHNSQHNNIVCSQEYLSCALKIAHSLADQLSVVDEKKKVTSAAELDDGEGGGITLDPLIINEIMVGPHQRQWQQRQYDSLAHSIYVRCGAKRKQQEEKDVINSETAFSIDDLEPLPMHPDQSSDPDDLGILGQQLSFLLEDGIEHNIEYSNVLCATLREDVVIDVCNSFNARMVAIHALGSTFFQLFSGGNEVVMEGVNAVKESPAGMITLEGSDRLDHMSKKTQRTSTSSMSPSVEPLKSLGLPTALCDLIGNMIDCTKNGGVTVDESYDAVAVLREDLKLMMDSPEVYLRDLDMMHASNVGLQMGSICRTDGLTSFYGRESELEMLKDSYQRSISNGCEVAMIYGLSGIGKSVLSSKFAEHVRARRIGNMNDGGSGIFLSGSFDKLQQSQPFHAISSAFDEYCTRLGASDKSTVEMVTTALRRDLGDEMSSLVTVIPNLRSILGNDFVCDKSDENSDVAVDAQKSLRYLFCQFVGIILDCQKEPLVLFLDDCQWIDSASVALLNQILMMPNKSATKKQRQFFFFGCCRDDEVNKEHPLVLMLSSLGTFGLKTTNIMLTSMSKETVNEMVSTTLSLLPRLTRPLSDILYHKTKGSPLFIKQLMIELHKRHFLYPSLTHRRWVWESDNIRDMEIPDSVAMFIMNSFHSLPPDVRSALCVLSFFGASVSISLIETLEAGIQTPLMVPLDTAIAESIVDKREESFYFIHDKLREAAYDAISSEQRCLQHFQYGLVLGNVALRERDDMLLFTAVNQINHGGPQAVVDSEQGVAVASLNLDAGKKAMKMSDIFLADSFFGHGISYLRRGHWEEQYDLSLELFNLAAKCALMNAQHAHLETLIQQITHYAHCFEDKCQAVSISISLLFMSGKMQEGVKATLSTLASLGEELNLCSPWWVPQLVLDYITPSVIRQHLSKTEAKLAGLSDETLLSYPAMASPSKMMAMELMSRLFELAFFAGENTKLLFIPSKMIEISLNHGMSPLSPLAFVQYGNYNAIIGQNYEVGYHYVKLGLALMKQSPSRSHDCQIMLYSAYTRMHVEPLQTACEIFLDGFKAAMKTGDSRYAMKCAYFYDVHSFWTSKKLDELVRSMEETLKQLRFHKNLLVISSLLPVVRFALRMVGESVIPQQNSLTSVFGETHNEQDMADKNPSVMIITQFIDCYEAFIFREFDKARDCANTFFSSLKMVKFSGAVFAHRVFYFGLVSFWIGRETNDKKWIARGTESKLPIEKLAVLASRWNFQNKTFLLQAEEQFCARNFDVAEKLYDDAISSSKMHKFVNEEALANELAGHFYLDTGRKNKAVRYFCQAEEKYREWGAVAKANEVANYM